MARIAVRLFVMLAVSPAIVLGPCYGEVAMLLPAGVGVSISDSLLPDRSARGEVEGQADEEKEVTWAPIESPWAWSDLDPAWQPLSELEPPQSFLAFWKAGASVFPQQAVTPLMPMPLTTEAPVGGAGAGALPAAEIDLTLEPGRQTEEAWSPAEADGIPGASASGPSVGEGSISPLLVLQQVGECSVLGEVSDKTTLDPIVGAIVTIGGTGREAETDAQGRFRVDGLPRGDYLVEALKLGYSMGSASASPRPGSPAEVRIALAVKPNDTSDGEFVLAEEVVVGEYNENAQGDFNLDLSVSPTIQSGLTEADFAKQNVSDAGEALEKVSGANVVDGAFAVVRGLADRYVNTTFNGGAISSAVPSRKAVRLDLFPTSTLSAIVVDKLYQPYLTGDFGGASIDIQSRVFPESPVLSFKYKEEYNPDIPDQILMPADAELEYFGGLDQTLNPNAITNSEGFLIGGPLKPSADNGPEAERAQNAWTTLFNSRDLVPVPVDKEPTRKFNASVGDTIELAPGIDLGFLVAGGAGGEDAYNESPILRQNGNTWYQQEYSRERNWNLYAAAGLRLGEFHEISGIYFRKNITQYNVTEGTNVVGGNYGDIGTISGTRPFYGADAYNTGNFVEIDPVEQDLQLYQISGRHKTGERGPSVVWGITQSDAVEDRPNYSLFRTTTLDFAAEEQFQQVRDGADDRFFTEIGQIFPDSPEFGSLAQAGDFLLSEGFSPATVDQLLQGVMKQYPVVDPSLGQIDTLALLAFTSDAGEGNTSPRTVQSIEESTNDQHISIDLPYFLSEEDESRGVRLGFGFSQIEKTRETRGSIYSLVSEFKDPAGQNTLGLPQDLIVDMGPDFAADPGLLESLLSGYLEGSPYYTDNTLGGILNLINNVDGFHDITAQYFSGEFFWDDFFFKGGVRYESEVRTAEILQPRPNLPPELLFPPPIEEDEMLPMVTAGLKTFDGRLNFILGWSRTVARPTFYEWLPTRSVDLSTGLLRLGNPGLQNSQIENYDLGAEWQVNENSSLKLGFFKKEISNPVIEERRDPNTIGYSNGDRGEISGFEIEGDMQNIGPFSLGANLTYIDAALTYTVESLATGMPETTVERFPFQPEWIFNFNLGYEKEDWDLSVNLIYNYTGEYFTVLRRVETDSNLEQQATHGLDLVVRKGFGDPDDHYRWVVSAGIKNLIATDRELIWRGGSPNIDGQLNQRFAAQRTFFVEAKCSF